MEAEVTIKLPLPDAGSRGFDPRPVGCRALPFIGFIQHPLRNSAIPVLKQAARDRLNSWASKTSIRYTGDSISYRKSDRRPSRNAKLLAPQCSSLQNSFLEFPKRHKALHVFHSINIYRSVQMIDFVLEDSGLESLHVHGPLFPMSIKVGNGNLLVTGDQTAGVRET